MVDVGVGTDVLGAGVGLEEWKEFVGGQIEGILGYKITSVGSIPD